MLNIPLLTNTGQILGVIQIINAKNSDGDIIPFDNEDELFVTHFAGSATLVLQRAQMTRAILLRMISMAELRDPKETGAHVNRVASYSIEIYERWAYGKKLPEHEILNWYKERWSIEIEYWYLKQCLGLGDFRVQSYEAIEKWYTVVCLVLTFLQWQLYESEKSSTSLSSIAEVMARHREEHAIELLKHVCKDTIMSKFAKVQKVEG